MLAAADSVAAAALVSQGEVQPTEADVLLALERGWWGAATAMLRAMRERGEAVGAMKEVRSTATKR